MTRDGSGPNPGPVSPTEGTIPDEKLAANALKNPSEARRGIDVVLFDQLELALQTLL